MPLSIDGRGWQEQIAKIVKTDRFSIIPSDCAFVVCLRCSVVLEALALSVSGSIPFSRKVALATVAGATCLVSSALAQPSPPEIRPATVPAGAPVTSPLERVLNPGSALGGWYLGGHVGYAHGRVSTMLCDSAPPNSAGSFGRLYGGILVGYRVLLPARLLLGLEADVSFPNFFDEDDLISSRKTST